MAAHTHAPAPDDAPESPIGAVLLPLFALATIIGVVVIAVVIAFPGTITLLAALATVVGGAAGIVWLLDRVIGPEEH
jgi:hypothetical protein